MSLQASLKPFFATLPKEDKLPALRAVSHYILFNNYAAFRERIKPLSKTSHELLSTEIRSFIKSSFECRKIWRSVRFSLSHEDFPFSQAALRFHADLSGMELVWKALLPLEQEELKSASLSEDYGSLDLDVFSDLIQRLDKYCGKVSYLKLRFLADNDSSLELKDLRAELLAYGIQAARIYEHTKNLPLIENYCKASIQNHAINLIQHFTSESRACVKNTTVGCGTCVFCLTDKPQRCPHAVADYRITSLSLEGLGAGLGSAGLLPHYAEEYMVSQNMLSALNEGASPALARVVNMVMGTGVDEEFEIWLKSTHNLTVDALAQHPKRLVKFLCSFLDISSKEVFTQLRTRYESYTSKVA